MPPRDMPTYVEWVIDQKPELKDTPEDIKAELRVQLEERLENLVNAALVAQIPPTEVEHFERLLVHGTDDLIQEFIQANVPNSEEIISGVLIQFRNDYLGS